MLVLRRKTGESLVIGGTITVEILAVEGESRVKLGITAPRDIPVVRSELERSATSLDEKDLTERKHAR